MGHLREKYSVFWAYESQKRLPRFHAVRGNEGKKVQSLRLVK